MIILTQPGFETNYEGLLIRYYGYLLEYFKSVKDVKIMSILEVPDLDKNTEDIVIFDVLGHYHLFISSCEKLLTILKNYKQNSYAFRLMYIGGDFFPTSDKRHMIYLKEVLTCTNYKVIHSCMNLEQIFNMWKTKLNTDISIYRNNYIFFPFFMEYTDIMQNINDTPINTVILCGNIHTKYYPERALIKQQIDKQKINNLGYLTFSQNSNFTKQLSEYIGSIATNIHIPEENSLKIETNAKFFLLKYVEILASGSLLIVDDSIKQEFEMLGLYHMYNCFVTPLSELESSVAYITNPENRDIVDLIRINGYKFYKDYKNKCDDMRDIIFKNFK